MSRMHPHQWSLAVALLLTPAALEAQAPTVVCKDGSNASSSGACAGHGGLDSVMTAAAWKARGQAAPVETGQVDTTMNPPSHAGMTSDTGRAGMARDTETVSRPGAAGYQPRSDTALTAKPRLQTVQARGDTGGTGTSDTTTAPTGGVHKKGATGYHHTATPSDTALRTRPGMQAGKTSADTGKAKMGTHRRHRTATDSTRIRADSAGTRPDSTR
jgi:hypothetical protein